MINIYALNISESLPFHEVSYLLHHIPMYRREKILKYKRSEDALRSLYAGLLVHHVTAEHMGYDPALLNYSMNEYGKPYVQAVDGFHYNLSHSGDWVVCATSNTPVGIDVERIQPIGFDIADRYFTENEKQWLLDQQFPSQNISCFYELWTLKESFIKCVGKGLSIPLDSFSIDMTARDHELLRVDKDSIPYYFKQYKVDQEYEMAICASESNLPDEIHTLDIHEFVRGYLTHT